MLTSHGLNSSSLSLQYIKNNIPAFREEIYFNDGNNETRDDDLSLTSPATSNHDEDHHFVPLVPATPPLIEHPGNMLSTIEEVTTAADTTDDDLKKHVSNIDATLDSKEEEDKSQYTDNFGSSNISDTVAVLSELTEQSQDNFIEDKNYSKDVDENIQIDANPEEVVDTIDDDLVECDNNDKLDET